MIQECEKRAEETRAYRDALGIQPNVSFMGFGLQIDQASVFGVPGCGEFLRFVYIACHPINLRGARHEEAGNTQA